MSKQWEELSGNALEYMRFLGNFGPTENVYFKEVKGCMNDDDGSWEIYIDSSALKNLSAACLEVAAWLEERAELAEVEKIKS